MKIYDFAKVLARSFPTNKDIANPWIFSDAIKHVINVSSNRDEQIEKLITARDISYSVYPLQENVDDIGFENILLAVTELLHNDKANEATIVHCDCGNHRSRLVIESFFYAKYGKHFEDNYKGFFNHLIYDCELGYLPSLQEIENRLSLLSK